MINVCIRGKLQARYSLGVWRGQADYRSNIHSVYEWFRRITDLIVIHGMQGLGGLLTEYSSGVWRGQADYQPTIQ